MKEPATENSEAVQSMEEVAGIANVVSQEEPATTTVARMGWADSARIKFYWLWLHRTDLWEQVCRFGRWLEFEAAPVVTERNESETIIELQAEGAIRCLRIGAKPHDRELDEYAQLWGLLWSLTAIRTVSLRVSAGQISRSHHPVVDISFYRLALVGAPASRLAAT